MSVVGTGADLADAELEDLIDAEVRPAELDVPVADRAADRPVREHPRSVPIGRVHAGERVRHGDHQWPARDHHPVHLSQHAPEVVDVVDQRVVGDHRIDQAARGESEVGELGDMALHGDLGSIGRASQRFDPRLVGVDGDRLRTGQRDRDRVLLVAHAEFEHAHTVDEVAAEAQLVVVGQVAAVPDGRRHTTSLADR